MIMNLFNDLKPNQRLAVVFFVLMTIILYPQILIMGIILIGLYFVVKSGLISRIIERQSISNNNGYNKIYREAIPQRVKMYVWQRDGGKCVYCGSNRNLEYDHIISVAKGGNSTERNIQLLCQDCNRSKGANI